MYIKYACLKKYINTIAWHIHSLERLLVEIEKDLKRVLFVILDMQSIYIKYLDQTYKADKKHNKICSCILRLE